MFSEGKEYNDAKKRLQELTYQGQREQAKTLANRVQHSGRDFDLDDFVIEYGMLPYSPESFSSVKYGLSSIPKVYRQPLEDAGYKVVVGETLDQVLPEIAYDHPRGWRSNATWHNSNGTFYEANKWIVVGERYCSIFDHTKKLVYDKDH